MKRFAALLRAVNVGGRTLAMADFKALLAAEGFEAPETLLASGNGVFGSDRPAGEVEQKLEAALVRHGLPTQALVRDAAQFADVLAGNPFARMAAEDPARLAVVFLRGEPAADLSALEPYCSAGEEVAPGPACLYASYPGGQGSSKLLLTVIEKKLGVTGTARNWNTVGKLARLTGTPGVTTP